MKVTDTDALHNEGWKETYLSSNKDVGDFEVWDIDNIDSYDCQYNLIYSERGGGKTTAVFWRIIKHFWESKGERKGFLIKRDAEDLRPKYTSDMLSNIDALGWVYDLTDGEYDHCVYASGRFYLARWNDELQKSVKHPEAFMYTGSLSTAKRNKGAQYPDVDNIVFDEFILPAHESYLDNEVSRFLHLISTIVRSRHDVKIWMLGNTVGKINPYFTEMGLYKCKTQEKHTIDVYEYNATRQNGEEGKLRVGVEFFAGTKGKGSDTMFAFGNITSANQIVNGDWEIPNYLRPYKYKYAKILYSFFLIHDDMTFVGEICRYEDYLYLNFRPSYQEIKEKDFVYSLEDSVNPYHYSNLSKPYSIGLTKLIAKLYNDNKVTFATNDVGAYITSYSLLMNKTHFTNTH